MFYLNQQHLKASIRPQLLTMFNYLNLGLIVGLTMWPFPKQFGFSFYLTAIIGALLAILLVLSPQYKPKRIMAASALLLAIILATIISWRDLPLIGLLSVLTSILVLVPFIYPYQFNNRILRLSFQFLLAPFFFLITQIFSGIHFIPENLLIKLGLFLIIIYLLELTTHNRMITSISYVLWACIIIAVILTHLIHGWHLILFAGSQLLLIALQLGLIKPNCYLQELGYLLLITGIFN
ncbi:hypothetical protein GKC32_04635 [Lactobacillus curvatus]|nr:hypothetical protein [Latilactobacillus curvatus]MSE23752.1 hypothetical protein [Latilactobacillus curvatus]